MKLKLRHAAKLFWLTELALLNFFTLIAEPIQPDETKSK
tara:strand:- start:406 stop:522 length:117 start_codon:yes stop_codon:yes gene_type:complete